MVKSSYGAPHNATHRVHRPSDSVENPGKPPHINRVRQGRPSVTGTTIDPQAAETRGFEAEVGRLLDLVVHSLYSDREIFLRELVANAADATDRRRFESLTHPDIAPPETASVRITPNRMERSIRIADDGIGMTRDELIAHLGTIARSGSRAFGEVLAATRLEDRPNLIGQFGVGFYSAFMVAERVEVISRKAGHEDSWCWASAGGGEYTIAPAAPRDTAGTDIVLHIKPDADEFLEPLRLETIVRKWADHITLPITIERDGKQVAANDGTALWRKTRADISEQDYTEFYRHLGHMFDSPWATLHWRAEGTLEFHALLFIPGMKPFAPVEEERTSKLRLHVRRMFITDSADLLPPWLRFVQGVVDTEDLPLNVSREILQATPIIGRIRKAVTNRVITELKAKSRDAEAYAGFWNNFGPILKEGVWEDGEYRADLAPLLRFHSTEGDMLVSLAEYVGRMKPGQESIFYLIGDDPRQSRRSAQIEGFSAQGVEVLILTDAIDAFWPERLDQFDGKKFVAATHGAAELAALSPPPPPGEPQDVDLEHLSALVAAVKALVGDQLSDVRTTNRLVDSAIVLAPGANGPDLQMQRLLKRAGRMNPAPRPILELNPRHPLIAALARRQASGEPIEDAVTLLFDLARIQEGDPPDDPTGFARRVERMIGAWA